MSDTEEVEDLDYLMLRIKKLLRENLERQKGIDALIETCRRMSEEIREMLERTDPNRRK